MRIMKFMLLGGNLPVLIFSCGRTGTNMLLEILRGSVALQATKQIEDKTIFRKPRILKSTYLSKCDTVYVDNYSQIIKLLSINKDLKILWTIRDLRDCALSKIYRGQPGNDNNRSIADDATFDGCLEDIEKMVKIYYFLIEKYPERVFLVKMEEVILNFDKTIQDVCDFVGIEFEKSMKNFTNRYRLQAKKRYKTLDKNQVKMYNRKYEIYDNFFKNHKINLDLLFEKLEKFQDVFGYEK